MTFVETQLSSESQIMIILEIMLFIIGLFFEWRTRISSFETSETPHKESPGTLDIRHYCW
jgi:hypothetical protein